MSAWGEERWDDGGQWMEDRRSANWHLAIGNQHHQITKSPHHHITHLAL